jgi:hypothetical protein
MEKNLFPRKCKGEGPPMTCLGKHRVEAEVQFQPIPNPPLEGGVSTTVHRFAPGKNR